MSQFDVVVIGAGPGGYVAAIRAAQLGFKTACIDAGVNKAGDAPALGGTCLNVGCIPSKALLQSSEHFHAAQHDFAEHGITVGNVQFDAAKMIERKDAIVTKLTGGIKFLFQKNKVTSLFGTASFVGKNGDFWQLEVDNKGEKTTVEGKHIIVATGSTPRALPLVDIDNVNVLDNEGALNLTQVPAKLGVIGAGVIGLEMGSVWKRVGAEVTILEASPVFLGAADQQIAKEAFKYFTREQGLNIQLGVKLNKITSGSKVVVEYSNAKGEAQTAEFDKLIVAIGRVPNTHGLNAEAVGLQKDERGFIVVDGECRTNLPNVWAIGDVTGRSLLAHAAYRMAEIASANILDPTAKKRGEVMRWHTVPWAVFSIPEAAGVGLTESAAKREGRPVLVAKVPALMSGRFIAENGFKAPGEAKILVDPDTHQVLGIHVLGAYAAEMIWGAQAVLEMELTVEDLRQVVFPHPTVSEVIREAAWAVKL